MIDLNDLNMKIEAEGGFDESKTRNWVLALLVFFVQKIVILQFHLRMGQNIKNYLNLFNFSYMFLNPDYFFNLNYRTQAIITRS